MMPVSSHRPLGACWEDGKKWIKRESARAAVDIAIMPPSEVFHAGEQLRLTIAGHEFAAPASTKAPAGLLAFMHPLSPVPTNNAGIHVIHSGGDRQSFLQIPVIP